MEQRVVPFLAYEDGGAAIEWLCRVFGFRELERIVSEDGSLGHGTLELEGGIVYLATPTPDYRGPKRHAETCEDAQRWLQVPWVIDGVLVEVDDLDAHFERARAEGAEILSRPEEGGAGRQYRAADLEGHRWMFAQHRS